MLFNIAFSSERIESRSHRVKALLSEVEGFRANGMARLDERSCSGARKIDRRRAGLRFIVAGIFGSVVCCAQPASAQPSALTEQRPDNLLPREIGLGLRMSPGLSKPSVKGGKPSFRSDGLVKLQLVVAPEIESRHFSLLDDDPESPLPLDRRNPPYDPTTRDSMPAPVFSEQTGGRRSGLTDGGATTLDSAPADTGAAGGLGWGIPPIRWGGSTGLQARRTSNSDGAHSSDLQEFINLRGASYLYQPWLAQISGNLVLSTSNGKSSGEQQIESQSNSTSISGGGSLNLFPISRFPTLVTYDVSDSRNSSEIVSNNYTNSRLGIRQSYRPEAGNYSATAGYNSSVINTEAQGKDTVHALYGDFSRNTELQSLQTSANYSTSTRDWTSEGSRLLTLSARHAYRAQENLTFDSLATVTDNTLNYNRGSLGMAERHGRYAQFNSYANWHPEEDEEGNEIPLNVNGGVRAFSALNDTGGSSTDNLSLGANLSATYRYSPNLSLTGNGLVTRVTGSGSSSQLLALFGGGANYAGDPLNIGKYSYIWNVGANGNQQTGGIQGSIQTISGQLFHSLSRPVELDEMSALYLSFGQSVAETSDSRIGNTASLSHNAGVTYRVARGVSLSGSASLNANDTMTTGAIAGRYTALNLQLSGQAQFSLRSSGSVNLTFQRSRTDNSSTENAVSSVSGNTNIFGSAVYQHQRAFGVPGLRYALSFNANTLASSRDERLAGNVNAPLDNAAYFLENRVDYRIGLLDLQLKGVVTDTAGKKNALIFLMVTRQFGRY